MVADDIDLPRQVVARALADAAAIFLWGWVLTTALRPLLVPDAYDLLAFEATLATTVVVATAIAVPAVRRSERLVVPVTGAGMVVLAGAIAAFDRQPGAESLFTNPALSLVGAGSLVAGLVLGTKWGAVSAFSLALWHGWWAGTTVPGGVDVYLGSLLTAATGFVGASLVVVALARSAREISRLNGRLLAERRAEHALRVRELSRATAQTDVHDTVLTTLSGIGAGWLTSSDAELLRAELRRDEQVLAQLEPPERDGVVELGGALQEVSGTGRLRGLHVHLTATGPVHADAAVAEGIIGSVREALTNVVKHAGVPDATVGLTDQGGVVEVVVRDQGAGTATDQDDPGMGVLGIEARMTEVGGRAVITSTPAVGTTVTLTWPHVRDEGLPPLWSVDGPRRGAIGLTIVASFAATLSFLLQVSGYSLVWPPALALALILLGDALTVVVLLRTTTVPGWLVAGLVVRIPLVVLLSGLPLSGCTAMTEAHFSGGGQLVMCVVIALVRPWPAAGAALLAYAFGFGVLAAPLYAAGQSCGLTAINQSGLALGYVIAGLWSVRALRRHAGMAAVVLAAEEELRASATAREARAAERRRLLPAVQTIVTETMQGLLDGRLDPADPVVRQRCRTDAGLVRSFLTQAGTGDEVLGELFARSLQLREAGIRLAVRGTLPRDSVPDAQRRALLAALDATFDELRTSRWSGQAWITVLRGGQGALVTAVLRGCPGASEGVLEGVLPQLTVPDVRMVGSEAGDGELRVTWQTTANEGAST